MGRERPTWNWDRFYSLIMPGVTPGGIYDFADKPKDLGDRVSYMLDRTQAMFTWSGLPDTIPARSLELYLQMNGNACIAEADGKLWAFVGGLGGEPDPYYMPTECVVANPALKLTKTFRIGEDCVIIPNDSLYRGLLPLMNQYGTGLVEAELSLNIALINSRLISLIEAMDDRSKDAAQKMLDDIRAGKLGVIGSKTAWEDGNISATPYGQTGNRTLTDLIETIQYLKASFFNEIGLDANFNMKRESINASESQLNRDALLPLVDDMLRMRQEGAEKVNAMFGTNISVDYASAWEDNQIELEAEQDAITEAGSGPDPEEGGEPDEQDQQTSETE